MTGYESKRAAAQEKLNDDDALTIAYQSGYYDGKKAAQEPNWAWATKEDFYRELDRRVERMRKEMEIKTVTMRCKDYDVALNIVDMYGGHVVVGQVSFPPQRTWVGMPEDEKEKFVIAYYPSNWDRKTAVALMNNYEAYLKEKNT